MKLKTQVSEGEDPHRSRSVNWGAKVREGASPLYWKVDEAPLP